MSQPSGMVNSNGFILTVGMQVVLDRCAIVIPLCTDATIDKVLSSSDVVAGFFADPFDKLLDCISEDTYITYLAAEGMVDGVIPHRADYTATDHPGTRTGPPLPAQVAGLITFYEDPDDASGGRLRVSKNFIPGLSVADVAGDSVVSDLVSNMEVFAESMLTGFAGGSNTYYRISAAVRGTPGFQINRIAAHVSRGYVGTQKRRLIPRG